MHDIRPEEVTAAQSGDRRALERLLSAIQGDVYAIALRMLWHPEDARDATQEILLKVATRLATFRGQSRLSTWVFSVAANHLRDFRKSRLEAISLDFDAFAADLADGLEPGADDPKPSPEREFLLEEIKVGCTLGMLACLDRGHRLAYILGEILGLDDQEAAGALDIKPATFRKRLSRARRTVGEFVYGHCGIVNPANACRCSRRARRAIALGRVVPERPLFARTADAPSYSATVSYVRSLERARSTAALMRSNRVPPADIATKIVAALGGDVAQR